MTVKKIGIDVSLTGAEKVTGKLNEIGATGQAAASKVSQAFVRSTTDAAKLQMQLNILTQATQNWSGMNAAARSQVEGIAAAIKAEGAMAGATAAQIEQLAAAQAIMSGTAAKATSANTSLATSHKVAAESAIMQSNALGLMERMLLRMVLAYKAISGTVGIVKDAAQFEMLGVAMRVVGLNAGYSASQMAAFEKAMTGPMGISMIGARKVLAQMAGAHLDLSKAAQLSRMAQDAGKLANINSTEAFERMIQAIVTGQPRMLRTMHILVSFEQAYQKFAQANKIVGRELTETEKVTARLNATLAYGANFVGVYEEAFKTAGSQMLSAQRYAENARVAIGTVFLPEISVAVRAYASALRLVSEHGGAAAAVLAAIGTAAIGLAGKWLIAKISFASLGVMALNPVTMGIVAVAAAVGVLVWQLDRAKRARDQLNAGLSATTDAQLENTRLDTQAARNSLVAKMQGSLSGTGPQRSFAADQKELASYTSLLSQISLEQGNRARAKAQAKQLSDDAAAEANAEAAKELAKAAAAQLKKNQAALDKRVGGVIPETIKDIANQRAEAQAIREKTAAITAGGEAKDKQRIKEAGDLAFAAKMADLEKERALSAEQGTTITAKQAAVYATAAAMARESAEALERQAVAEDHAKEAVKASAKAYDAYMDAITKPIRALEVKRDALERMSDAQRAGKEATEAERIALAGEAAARGILNDAMGKGLDLYTSLIAAVKAMRLAEGNERIVIANEKVKAAAQVVKQTTDRMWRGIQEGLANALEEGFERGFRSARDFVASLGSLFRKALSESIAAGITGKLRGATGSFGMLAGLGSFAGASAATPNVANAAVSGVGNGSGILGLISAHPVIAGVTALGASILAMGASAKQAARDVKAMGLALQQSLSAWRYDLGLTTDKDRQKQVAAERRDAEIQKAAAIRDREKDRINAQVFTTRWAKDHAKDVADEKFRQAVEEINRLYGINIEQINKSNDALDKFASALNSVSGYKYQAAIFGAANPYRNGPPESAVLRPRYIPSTQGGGAEVSAGGELTVNVTVDGAVIGKATLKNFKATAQRQFGDSSRWSEVQ